MGDTLTKAQRSARMARIRSKNTKPELYVRKKLWSEGFRYRLHSPKLPGKPDIVLPALRTVVLVHGCYWHAHTCQKGRLPDTNSRFWADKFAANRARDRLNNARLKSMGWNVITVWECSLATNAKRARTLGRLIARLRRLRGRSVLDFDEARCDNPCQLNP